jgi:hypothetical protein
VPARIYSAIWEHYSTSTQWVAGGINSGIWQSQDGGDSWTHLTDGLPNSSPSIGRIGLAVAGSNSQTVYALYLDDPGKFLGVYKTTNAGLSWARENSSGAKSAFGGYGYSMGQIRVDPGNENVVYLLDIYWARSTNGGQSYTAYGSGSYVDHHDMVILPDRLYQANDGGFYRSTDLGNTWFHSPELAVTQFYDLGLDRLPWTDPRLTGLVDFPGFRVAPCSRRGVLPDDAAGAFTQALATIEPLLVASLDSLERRRAEVVDRVLIRDLQRAYRDFYRQRPRYEMPPVRSNDDRGAGPEGEGSGAVGIAADLEEGDGTDDRPEIPSIRTPLGDLLPAGPLDRVRLTPSPIRVECSGRRGVRAHALDAKGHAIEDPATYEWSVAGNVGTISEESPGHAVLIAAGHEADGRVAVTVRSRGKEAHTAADVMVVDEIRPARSGEGIPDPDFVNEPGGSWRSRFVDASWQVNAGHRDYRAITGRPTLKLRYLAMLFAKEIVLRSSQDPRLDKPLEQLVEVAAYADRNVNERKSKRGPSEER